MYDGLTCAALCVCLTSTIRPLAPSVSLSRVMQWFKTMTTAEYFRGVKTAGWPRVDGRLWQRSFYERVVRSDREFKAIRKYIETNPGALFERVGMNVDSSGRTRRSAPTIAKP
jgi:hypothetical protein